MLVGTVNPRYQRAFLPKDAMLAAPPLESGRRNSAIMKPIAGYNRP